MDKIFAIIMTTFAFGFVALPTMFLMLIAGNTQYMLLIGMLFIIGYLGIVLKIIGFFKSPNRTKIMVGISVVAIVASAVPAGIAYYKNSLATVESEVMIWDYIPFVESNKVATLGEPATLTLAEPLPILDGATAMFPIYTAVMQATYPERISYFDEQILQMNTTPYAYKNVIDGLVDIAFLGPPSKQQENMAEAMGKTLELTPIGKEAFVFFVHKDNPVDTLTITQIQQIYSGEITNWSQVGGENKELRAFQRPQDSGSQTALQSLMGDIPIMEAPVENVTSGMGGIIEEVSQYRNYGNAIGYSFRYYTTEMVGNDDIKLLAIEGIEPAKENIRDDRYPITSNFYAITAGTTNPNVAPLLQWLTSEQGQRLVEKVGYVPLSD